jgi:hypothetical protein
MHATVTLTPPTTTTTTPPTFNHAVFGDTSITMFNSLTLKESASGAKDADLFSNGPVSCENMATIEGDVTSPTDISFTHVCTVRGNVWAGNKISTTSKLTIDGDAIAAGPVSTDNPPIPTINTGSSGEIKGHAMANGDIVVENSSTINGSAVSTNGKIALGNSGRIKGSAYVKTNVEVGNSATIETDAHAVTGTISGINSSRVGTATGRCVGPRPALTVIGASTPTQTTGSITCGATNPAFPANVKPPGSPPRAIPLQVTAPDPQPFPVINSDASTLTAWNAAGWTIKNFKDPVRTGNRCDEARTFLTGLNTATLAAWSGPLLVVIPTCTSNDISEGLTWINDGSILLKHDLAIMSDEGFLTMNNFTVTTDNGPHNLYWIVPSDSPRVTPSCTNGGSGSIKHQNRATVEDDASWLIFTPCKVTFANAFGESGHPVKGQIYGGKVDVTNAIYLQMHGMTVPGATGGGMTPGTPTVNPTAAYSAVASHKSER